jgi:hypothetical protein
MEAKPVFVPAGFTKGCRTSELRTLSEDHHQGPVHARRLHQSRRRRQGFDIVRISYIVGGALLIAVSALLGWLPVLGWGTAILGLSMIAAEFYSVALLMDRLEVRARELLGPLGKAFVRMPTWAWLWVSMLIAFSTFTLVYGLYSLSFG